MLRLSKLLACLVLVLAISLVQFSCQPQQVSLPPDVDETKQPIQSGNRGPFLSPITIPYLVANPLEIVYIDQPNSQDRILFINGLADKQVEDKINERLKSLYIDIKQRELPSYRGIKSKIPANSKPLSNDLHVSVPYNYNNVMSIILNNSRDYQTQYVNIVETLNFDLNTGEEITLKDVFTDDVDHVSLLSDHVSRLIQKSTATEEIWSTFGGSYMGGHNIKLVSPFKGILPDQKFNLFQGGLSLVFDYRNLEFDTMFMTDSLQIYFCDTGNNIAVTQRFYAKDSNIYTSKAPQGKEFVQTTYPSAQQIVVRRQEVSARYVSMSYSYPEGLPGHMVKFIRELSQTADKLLDQPDIWELHHSVSAGRVGSYVNVYASLNMYAKDRGDQLTQYYCFDSDYKQLSLSKLFVHGYDYRTVIMEKLDEALGYSGLEDPYSTLELYEALQFSLGTSELFFCTKPLSFSTSNSQSIQFQIPYKKFGCHNMTIFPE